MYVAIAALTQDFEHREVPATANARLKRVHGDGEGELVIDLDRLGDRSLWMNVASQAELTVTDEEQELELSVGRKIRLESGRE